MSINLIGVSASGGIPLFCRQKGSISSEGIPFVKMASLNSVNLFSRLNDTNLRSTLTKDSCIHWKIYRGSIVLILVATVDRSTSFHEMISKANMDTILDFIFDTIILTCGLTKLIESNTESLKSQLRLAFPAVDYILDQLYSGHHLHLSLKKFEYGLTDTWALPFLETLVDTAARLAASQYCCLLARKKVVAGTKHWWSKIASSRDGLLIINLVNSFKLNEGSSSFREATIYLPENCPNSAVRLIAFLVSSKTVLVFLCADTPPTKQLQEHIVEPLRDSRKDQDMFRKIVTEKRIPLHLEENIINLIVCRQDRNIFTLLGSLDRGKMKDLSRLIEMSSHESLSSSASSSSSLVNCHLDCYVNFANYKGYYCENGPVKLFLLLPFEKRLSDLKKIADKTMTLLNKERKLWP